MDGQRMRSRLRSGCGRLRRLCFLASLTMLSACWDLDPEGDLHDLRIMPFRQVVGEEVFFFSPGTERLVRLVPGPQGEEAYTDLEDSTVEEIALGPGGGELYQVPRRDLLALLSHSPGRDVLSLIDPARPCPERLEMPWECVTELEARPVHDRLEFSPDGRFALSYISSNAASYASEEVINLNELGVYDLVNRTVRFVTVGFDPQDFAFTQLDPSPRVVVLTASRVVLLDLETGATTPRDLTLSTATQLSPQQVHLSGDERFALVTIGGSRDLYTFDLSQESLPINILSLSGTPTTMVRSDDGAFTVVLSASAYSLDVIEHSTFEVESYTLSAYATALSVLPTTQQVVAYHSDGSTPYLHLLDLDRRSVQTYRLEGSYREVIPSPDGGALVVLHVGNGSQTWGTSPYAVSVLNLARGDRASSPILVASYPSAWSFNPGAAQGEGEFTFVLSTDLGGILTRVNLANLDLDVVDIPDDPTFLAPLGDSGRQIVLHDEPLGVATVFPSSDPRLVQFVVNFMAGGIL